MNRNLSAFLIVSVFTLPALATARRIQCKEASLTVASDGQANFTGELLLPYRVQGIEPFGPNAYRVRVDIGTSTPLTYEFADLDRCPGKTTLNIFRKTILGRPEKLGSGPCGCIQF